MESFLLPLTFLPPRCGPYRLVAINTPVGCYQISDLGRNNGIAYVEQLAVDQGRS